MSLVKLESIIEKFRENNLLGKNSIKALKEDIEKAEQRLGCKLPDELKSYYMEVANGTDNIKELDGSILDSQKFELLSSYKIMGIYDYYKFYWDSMCVDIRDDVFGDFTQEEFEELEKMLNEENCNYFVCAVHWSDNFLETFVFDKEGNFYHFYLDQDCFIQEYIDDMKNGNISNSKELAPLIDRYFEENREDLVELMEDDDYDEDEYYEDGDYDEDDDDYQTRKNIRLYGISEIEKLNNEIEEHKKKGKNLRYLFSRQFLINTGLLMYKKKYITQTDISLCKKVKDSAKIEKEIEKFRSHMRKSFLTYLIFSLPFIFLYIYALLFVSKWKVLWVFMTIYSIFNLVKRYFTYKKSERFIIECKNHLGEDCSESEDYLSDDKKELDYVMEFNNFISQEK